MQTLRLGLNVVTSRYAPAMSPPPPPPPRQGAAVAAALLALVLAGCGAAEPTLDEQIGDLDAAVELYKTVDGAECDDPADERDDGSTIAVTCEDGAVVVWDEDSTDDESQRQLTSAVLADEHGIDAVVGVNVTIMNVDREAVAAQIGGDHP